MLRDAQEHIIKDNRSHKSTEISSLGEGAISADVDLKLKGSGTLEVVGNYNNGIHTSKDLTIQKLTLKATGYNNAIKGKDSVTMTSGTVQAYAATGNGIKTEDSDLSSNNKQRGTISITGGSLYVDSLHDGIDASYNVEVDELDSEITTQISIKTGLNSSYYNKSSFKADSEKGLKAENEIIVTEFRHERGEELAVLFGGEHPVVVGGHENLAADARGAFAALQVAYGAGEPLDVGSGLFDGLAVGDDREDVEFGRAALHEPVV